LLFIFFALHDLTLAAVDNIPSNAVEWGLAEMINQPELIEKAIEELNNVVGTGRFVQESDIPKLDYVRACAREAFRRQPICQWKIQLLVTTIYPKGVMLYSEDKDLV
jgi:cytochrome P450